ncbi:MAG: hypothetical protein JWN73_11 [Betaproteobacteria bacterium]|nr:hypothetical protein [Betaproteobacteria bacterium]
MRFAFLIPLFAAVLAASSHAQTVVYRCAGNLYTTDAAEARSKNCKTMDGGNITVVQGTRVNSSNTVKVATAPQAGQSVSPDDQRARDSDARTILESELKKAETRQAELVKEYNNGEPEKLGPEHRNHQKWVERVAELKANIARTENDIAGIKRELARAASK